MSTLKQRLNFFVDSSGGPYVCWPFKGQTGRGGYGNIKRSDGKQLKAHRLALEYAVGPAPEGKPFALHSCDNPPCCNPIHLRWGTHEENMQDKIDRNRFNSVRGPQHHATIFTENDIRQIRQLLATGVRQKDIAADYGVSQSTISHIKIGRSWAHVTD